MAYISIVSLIAMLLWAMGVGTYAVVTGKSLLEISHIVTILSTLAVGFVSIVGAYVGFATWGDKVLTDSVYNPQYAASMQSAPYGSQNVPYGAQQVYPYGNNQYGNQYPQGQYMSSTEDPNANRRSAYS
jgi:hypothetical protein